MGDNMEKCLILLTNYYPFHKGEEYLETEIVYLAKSFSKIIILCTMATTNMSCRSVPSNVEVFAVNLKHTKLNKIKMFAENLLSIYKDSNKRLLIKEDTRGKPINRLFCYYFEGRAMNIYKDCEQILDTCNLKKYDKFIIYSYWLYITARVGVELKNKYFNDRKVHSISRAHGYDINVQASILNYIPQREYLLENLDNVFPCSQNSVDYLIKTYPKYSNKIKVKRLGTKGQPHIRASNKDSFHIVSCSTIRKLKRIEIIIEALAILEDRFSLTWTHIGDGPQSSQIKKLVVSKLNKTKVNLLGNLSNTAVLDWYAEEKPTVFVNTSSSEGVPVSIMEALSFGIPIVATNVGGTCEIVFDHYNGYLINPNATGATVADCIAKILMMENENYNALSVNAKKVWDDKCNSDTLYTQFTSELLDTSLKN